MFLPSNDYPMSPKEPTIPVENPPTEQVQEDKGTTLAEIEPKEIFSIWKKIGGIAAAIGEKIKTVIDFPFKKLVEQYLKTLRKLGLNSQEAFAVNDAVDNKYVPTLRNAAIASLAALPGILVQEDPNKAYVILGIITSVTGIAWFTITLEKVKEKFLEFGTELTANMLEAFLTTLLIIAMMSGAGLAEEQIAYIGNLASEAGIDIRTIISSAEFKALAVAASIGVGARIVSNTIKSTIKFDTNDALLTGTTEAAKRFYEQSLSDLRKAANLMKEEHSLENANFNIANALKSYHAYLLEIGITPSDGLTQENIEFLSLNADQDQRTIDLKAIPILKAILQQFEDFLEDSAPSKSKYDFAIKNLSKLEEDYAAGKNPPQNLADARISNALETIAEFIEQFQDKLI